MGDPPRKATVSRKETEVSQRGFCELPSAVSRSEPGRPGKPAAGPALSDWSASADPGTAGVTTDLDEADTQDDGGNSRQLRGFEVAWLCHDGATDLRGSICLTTENRPLPESSLD